MAWLLDTDIVVHLLEGDPDVRARVAALLPPLAISAITRVELENGVYRSADRQQTKRAALEIFLGSVDVLPFGDDVADCYAAIVANLGYSRSLVFDRMIAAQAIAANMTLITRNGADFRGIPRLELETW